ncbi:MAG: WbqC family protein [Pseudomonadota bacterium]
MNSPMTARTIAIMQPYFYPYLGYFALMHRADEFVVLDCVQFPRRGRVHRCQVPVSGGEDRWLTLPVARAPQGVSIRDLQFAEDAQARWRAALSRCAWARTSVDDDVAGRVRAALGITGLSVADYLIRQLRLVRDTLGLTCRITRSSDMSLGPDVRGADRLIRIARARGAHTYLNAPNGRALYDPAVFAAQGLQLGFLPPYDGPFRHLLPALLQRQAPAMIRDLNRYASLPLDGAEVAHA